ncbi:MAG: pyridoxal phosphate-dependent aminotransferase [Clostridia bacterium]|nr:pyridoxal phosphate-dependent aminotransferase [Clostridia bacterium]
MRYSEKCQRVQGSVTLQIDAKAKAMKAEGKDVVSFGAGEPDFNTPQYIIDAAIKALNEGKTKYTAAAGIPELRKAVCALTKKNLGIDCEFDQVVISNGAKQALFNALQAIVNPEDEVIIFAPYWVSYPELVKMAGGVPVFVNTIEEKGFAIDFEAFEKAITEKTCAIILNTPSNPSGAVLSESDIRRIAEIAKQHDLMIVSDEIYDCLLYDDAKHFSVTQIDEDMRERTVLINGMSKAYAMTGWRMGYSVSNKKLAKMMASYQSHATGNPNTITQYATLAALESENPDYEKMLKEFDSRRKYMVQAVNEINGLSAQTPKGAFYVMVSIKDIIGKSYNGRKISGSMDFAEILLDETMTAVVPGGPFGLDHYIRLSYATSMETIKKGLDRIKKFAEGAK